MHGFARVLGSIVLGLCLMLPGCSDDLAAPSAVSSTALFAAGGGNGAPNGAHYNLNIIGVPQDKTAAMDDNEGHRIFVKLWGKAKIGLAEGEYFSVLDANGTDGNGARFQLPDPDPENDSINAYSVWARALGKPGGWSDMLPGFVDSLGDSYYSIDTLTVMRGHGRQKFVDVTEQLLTINVDFDGDGIAEQMGLFGDSTLSYFWDYDNHGLKLLQLRFYPVTDVVMP